QEEERVKRRDGAADIPEQPYPRPNDVRERPERLDVVDAVVAGVGLRQTRKLPACGPVKAARIDDDASDRGAVAADPLGRRVHDDVGPPFEGTAEVRRGKRVVDDEGDPVFV